MRSMSAVLAAVPLILGPLDTTAQGVRWNLGLGRSEPVTEGRIAMTPSGGLAGARGGGRHLLLGVDRALGQSAVDLRFEVTGNEFTTRHPTYLVTAFQGRVPVAARDVSAAANLGAVFRARRASNWSPYLLVSAGYHFSFLRERSDETPGAAAASVASHGLGAAFGGGVTARVWRQEVFLETRRYTKSTPGSSWIPLTLGVRF